MKTQSTRFLAALGINAEHRMIALTVQDREGREEPSYDWGQYAYDVPPELPEPHWSERVVPAQNPYRNNFKVTWSV